MIAYILRALGSALILAALVVLAVSTARAQDAYADRWFTYADTAHDRLELRYTLSQPGAELYVRHWTKDPGDGTVTGIALGQFRVRCLPDGTAPVSVVLERVTTLDPVSRLPLEDHRVTSTPVAVDVEEPLGKIVAIVCAAHAYALRAGAR